MRLKKFRIAQAQKLLPKRNRTDNKSSAGKTLVVAGSEGMFGAGVLCAEAASRIGSGYVKLYTPQSALLTVKHPSFMVVDSKKNKLPDDSTLTFAIGPGLGKSSTSTKLVKQLLKNAPAKVVIDADALNICALESLWPLPPSWIATPHEGELARILRVSSQKIKADRRAAVAIARKKMGCICVLKGSQTLVAADSVFEIQSGNAALAKAGTGDVLTGMIAGLLAQGLKPSDAACLGVFIHGWVADQWVKDGNDQLSLMPEDLLKLLPKALNLLRG